jgi:predicted ATPase/class 3 adenylate cyclase
VEVQAEVRTPGPLPTGTVTFLFSDIEGSTQRWERDRSAMQDAVRRHDALVRTAIDENGGFIFKTIGDAFCAVFARPEDAVAAALAAQRAISREDFAAIGGILVRIALHTGTSEERDGDYFGPTVNRVARLLAIGHGGQVLVSGVTTDLIQGTLPAQATLQDLGAHRLKDLTLPEQVYQLLAPGLRREFPALRSLESLPNNLPLQLTSFVGRDQEVAEIEALLRKHRVVTLVGSGGVGKTRASLQVGANILDGSGDGVWFVELAPLSDSTFVPNAVATALGIELPPGGEPLAALTTALKTKNLVLILDNCEHLVAAAARVADALVRACPKVVVLASSRQGLGIAGEATYRMPSLQVPEGGSAARLGASDAKRFDSIALFVERAQAADPHFVLSDENAPAVADICRRLDGIAFAVELAAARVRMLSPQQLQRRLDERFRILTGGSRTALPRQQTLRALVDWSYDLLDERERALFRRVGIFLDGFSIEAAVAVCAGASFDELDVFDVLASLVDKSLVVAELSGAATRYRLLESTRAYALEKLVESNERDQLAERHLVYFSEMLERARVASEALAIDPFVSVRPDLENVRAAIANSINGGDVRLGAAVAMVANRSTYFPATECLGWLESLLPQLDPGEVRLRAQCMTIIAGLLGQVGLSARSGEVAEEALRTARASGDDATLFDALLSQSLLFRRADRLEEAMALAQEAEKLLPSAATPLRRVRFLERRGVTAGLSGDLAAAVRDFEDMRALCRSLGNEEEARKRFVNFAEFEHFRGNTNRAIEIAQEAVAAQRRAGYNRDGLANTYANLAGYFIASDKIAEGRATAAETLRTCVDPNNLFVALALEHSALAFAIEGDLARAARFAGFAEAAVVKRGFHREFTEQKTHERLLRLLAEMPEEERAAAYAEGAALSPEAAIDEALPALAAS